MYFIIHIHVFSSLGLACLVIDSTQPSKEVNRNESGVYMYCFSLLSLTSFHGRLDSKQHVDDRVSASLWWVDCLGGSAGAERMSRGERERERERIRRSKQ